jgi:hypothetical protein
MKTVIRIQIQITHRKISNIVQNASRSGYDVDDAARSILSPCPPAPEGGVFPQRDQHSPAAD